MSVRDRGPAARLFLTSATVLFVELLLIRWIPANVVYVGFFNNFLLIAAFLGIGLGILIGRRMALPALTAGPFLLAIAFVVQRARVDRVVSAGPGLFFGFGQGSALEENATVLPVVVVLSTLAMAGLAVPLGPLLRAMPPLRAYAIDIAGSLAGIAAFVALAAVGAPPLVWFGLASILLLAPEVARPLTATHVIGIATAVAALTVVANVDRRADEWSPYYRITLERGADNVEYLFVNGIIHQALWPAAAARDPLYEQVFRWFPDRAFRDVLVIGAGTGTDTAVALAHGATSVDAVEIDPRIVDIGRARHPDRPYQDPRVRLHVTDGRAFLRNADRRYDLVILAYADSLTLVTSTANLRLESFLFTEEAFASARGHLKPDGIFVLYNQYRQAWLVERLARALEKTFGSRPLLTAYSLGGDVDHAVLATGPGVAALGGGPPPGDRGGYRVVAENTLTTSDEWPFIYLRERRIPERFTDALGALLIFASLVAVAATASAGGRSGRASPHFFFLGVAFLLLETKSLVTFSLLFGTTWLVNALAFFAILISVLVAIGITARWPAPDPRPLYLGLFGSIGLAYVLPPSALLIEAPWLRYGLAAAVAFGPIVFANLVFARSFRDSGAADIAFGSNLLGAAVGGVLEWVALVTGYQALLLVVAACYLAAYVFGSRVRVLGDRALA